ncbi:SDR family NAD(P)-dependent oxidoreductase [Agaribacterium haliotis]|uniref:SDR family NAD(P)-dependent oxidoreductase n=1 Tax=Agaribacterium haliotis TaxID=2013869 RepID=UPI000BB53BA9|nr:SDR family NAD(P)-dependent oxidoreductase [Agaribacterium haliotis]
MSAFDFFPRRQKKPGSEANFAELSGLTIWLLGASSGIGLALAEALAKRRNFVFVSARSEDKLLALKRRYPKHIQVLAVDICDEQSLSGCAQQLKAQCDQLDLLVLNAGTCEYDDAPLAELGLYRRVFELNYFAQLACLKQALPLLKAARGRVLVTSSLAMLLPFSRAEAYGASKAALEYSVRSLAIDLHGAGLSFQIVRPGFVDTPLTKQNDFSMPWLMSAEQAAERILLGLKKGRPIISFPWPLRAALKIANWLGPLWLRMAAKMHQKRLAESKLL